MSNLKGTINYLRAVRDYCRIAGRCELCELYFNEVCPYHQAPNSLSDDHILKMINLTEAYTDLIKGMEEGEIDVLRRVRSKTEDGNNHAL